MMARLLEAVRPDARLILVGDPDQLASVEAGAVLADLVEGLAARPDARVATLRTSHRFGQSIGALAAAIRDGDADPRSTLLRAGGEHIEWVDTDDPAEAACATCWCRTHFGCARPRCSATPATALATLDEHRLLCAHRRGPHGVRALEPSGRTLAGRADRRPAVVDVVRRTAAAGDRQRLWAAGVQRRHRGDGGARRGAAGGDRAASGPLEFATSRLAEVETMHAMTIHKSQGSQADEVTVLMPPVDSRLLTRELFYTAVTRAKAKVRVVGSEAEVGRRSIGGPCGPPGWRCGCGRPEAGGPQSLSHPRITVASMGSGSDSKS